MRDENSTIALSAWGQSSVQVGSTVDISPHGEREDECYMDVIGTHPHRFMRRLYASGGTKHCSLMGHVANKTEREILMAIIS